MARLSNSAFTCFLKCPELFRREFIQGYQATKPYLEFGHRFHQFLQHHYCGGELKPSALGVPEETECRSMYEMYRAFYPVEPFEVIDCEQRFELGFGELYTEDLVLAEGEEVTPATHPRAYQHQYIGRIDMRVRDRNSHRKQLFETKTESRSSKRNLPDRWVARTQASLYLWADYMLTGEMADSIILNVATKGSEKGRVGPSFRRDVLQRTPKQIEEAIESLTYVCDQVDWLQKQYGIDEPWPRSTESCVSELGWKCDLYQVCHYGESPETLSNLVKVEPFSYLEL